MMSRISIDVTPEEHQRLKALAALQGKSIKDFVLARTLGVSSDADDALAELEALLRDRLRGAEKGGVSAQSVSQLFEEVRQEPSESPDA